MAMSPSPGRYRGKATAEPIMRKTVSTEPPLLHQLLSKATLQLASSLSNDEKEVLTYLVLFGRRVAFDTEPPSSVGKSPWKPWKSSSSKASKRQQVCHACSSSDSRPQSFVSIGLAEEVSSKKSPLLHAKHKASFSCDCFSCYSSFWGRWTVSPSRDRINEILDVIENRPESSDVIEDGPKNNKGKKKKKTDKKRAELVNEACTEKNMGRDENGQVHMSVSPGPKDELPMSTQISDDAFMTDRSGKALAATNMMDDTPHPSIMADESLAVVTQPMTTGRKKGLFRVTKKQEEEACVTTSRSLDSRHRALLASGSSGENAKGSIEAAVAIEVPVSLANEESETMDGGLSLAFSQGKNTTKSHQYRRIGNRRSKQVTPLDCEGVEKEQEAVTVVPRAADIGLGGRGFLARVFPDALGRVASRLWDLVSVRLRSRTVEYH